MTVHTRLIHPTHTHNTHTHTAHTHITHTQHTHTAHTHSTHTHTQHTYIQHTHNHLNTHTHPIHTNTHISIHTRTHTVLHVCIHVCMPPLQVSSESMAEWRSRLAHLNEVGNFLVELTDPQTSRTLGEELRRLNMHWADFVTRTTYVSDFLFRSRHIRPG